MIRRCAQAAMVAIVLGGLSGCNGLITGFMVHAPNRGRSFNHYELPDIAELQRHGVDRELRVAVGPPSADIRVWVVEPSASEGEDEAAFAEPRGTVLVLHGYRNRAEWMRDTAHDFADAGYRSVIVEMRGHGASSGDHITFGAVESQDVQQVIDELDRLDLIHGDLGVWGISMGASTAIKVAANDSRVRTVVAVAPYTHLRDVVPGFVRLFMPVYGWLMSDEDIQRVIDDSAAEAGFDPEDTNVLNAMRRVAVPVLILHGTWDILVPDDMGERLIAEAPRGSVLKHLKATNHVGSMFSDVPESESIAWFNRWLAKQP